MLSKNGNSALLRNTVIARELAVGVAATLILFISVLFVPVMGVFAGVFTPLPTLLSYYRWGSPLGLLVPAGAVLAGWLLFAYLSIAQSVPYLLEMVALGLLLGMGMRRGWSLEKTIGAASLLVFVSGSLIFWLTQGGSVAEALASLEQGLREAVHLTLQQYAGITPETRMLEESLATVVPLIVRILPGASLASALLMAWLNLLVAKRYCRLRQVPLPAWGSWLQWKASENLVWIVIAGGFTLLLPNQPAKLAALNALIVLGTVYLFQGLAIITFYFERWKLPKILRAIFYGFLLLQQFVSFGAVLLGFFDMWFDFRRLSKKPASSV